MSDKSRFRSPLLKGGEERIIEIFSHPVSIILNQEFQACDFKMKYHNEKCEKVRKCENVKTP